MLTGLIFIVSIWAILGQLYFSLKVQVAGGLIRFLAQSGHPLWYLYGLGFFLALITVVPLVASILWSERVRGFLHSIIERLSLLTSIYLALDLAALIILAVRNF